jgi:hypothetical protein
MTIWWEAFIILGVAAVTASFVWAGLTLKKLLSAAGDKTKPDAAKALTDVAAEEVNHLFNDQFREELRNHGRLYFEKIITDNAMFLKQDLDMTIAQLNEYLKTEITGKLNEEFDAYARAMQDAQQLALTSLQKSANAVEEQRAAMGEALKQDVANREAALVKVFEDNMSKIVEHYMLETLGQQFDLKTQMPFIISQMEANKEKIMEDMRL